MDFHLQRKDIFVLVFGGLLCSTYSSSRAVLDTNLNFNITQSWPEMYFLCKPYIDTI